MRSELKLEGGIYIQCLVEGSVVGFLQYTGRGCGAKSKRDSHIDDEPQSAVTQLSSFRHNN
jgi:hypothetical protein